MSKKDYSVGVIPVFRDSHGVFIFAWSFMRQGTGHSQRGIPMVEKPTKTLLAENFLKKQV
ncbi:MAG: hypothetical protein WD003_01920 [Candidatus Paceibacterota bacterium]